MCDWLCLFKLWSLLVEQAMKWKACSHQERSAWNNFILLLFGIRTVWMVMCCICREYQCVCGHVCSILKKGKWQLWICRKLGWDSLHVFTAQGGMLLTHLKYVFFPTRLMPYTLGTLLCVSTQLNVNPNHGSHIIELGPYAYLIV